MTLTGSPVFGESPNRLERDQGRSETRVLSDGWSVLTADGSLSAHWEHTIAITPDGPQVLTLPE